MEKCLVTLPITPVANPSLGLVGAILTGDFAARNLGLKFVLALGPSNMRTPVSEREETVAAFVRHLANVGIRPDHIWRSDSEPNQRMIRECFLRMLNDSLITLSAADVEICPCGVVEKLAAATEWYEKRRLYSLRTGVPYCKFCNQRVIVQRKPVYRFQVKTDAFELDPYPNFYANELQTQIGYLANTSLMVSRSRESSVKLETEYGLVYLDQDFAWQMYLPTLPSAGYEPSVLLGSNHNLRAIVLIRILQQNLVPNSTLVTLIPPYFLGAGGKRMGQECLMEALLGAHHKNSIRAIVGMSLNWKQKESAIDTQPLALLDKMAERLGRLQLSQTNLPDLDAFLEQCNYQKIRDTVKAVRGYKTSAVDTQHLCGIID